MKRDSTRPSARLFALTLSLAAFVGAVGCRPSGATADRLLQDTSIGQARCSEVDPTDRPFVVEWDATETAMFESLAQRDVVIVRYEGCELEILTACNDDGMAGRYGAYNSPMWTSGSVEGFDIKDEYDLYTKLPLGANSFAGKVASGATLSLQYFISGTVTSTRNAIGHGDLAGNVRCEGATHFVQAFNLGAFELDATESNEQRVDVKYKGVGAGGGHSRDEARLKHGGELESCKSEEARELTRCQVPIRLVLRPLDEGNSQALDAPEVTAPVPGGAAQPGSAKAVAELYNSALRKTAAGDGKGCLADLDRVRTLDADMDDSNGATRAQCEMLAGRCKEGMKRYRKWMQQGPSGASFSPSDLDTSTTNVAVKYCPMEQLTGQAKAVRLTQDIEAAKRQPDEGRCARLGSQLVPLVPAMKRRDKVEDGQQAMAVGAIRTAALCADEIKKCKDALKLMKAYVDTNPGIEAKDRAAMLDSANRSLSNCAG